MADRPPQPGAFGNRLEQIYPRLTREQIETLRPLGEVWAFAAGQVLWRIGERGIPFFVVLEGELDIIQRTAGGAENIIVSHGEGAFSGETSTLAGRAALVEGRARTPMQCLALSNEALRQLIVTDSTLSELIMRAFILRRANMIAQGLSGVTLIGSRYTGATVRLEEFLTRNGHPHTMVDLERETDVANLLERFGVGVDDTPVVLFENGTALRNPSIRELADGLGITPAVDTGAPYDLAVVGAGPAGLGAAVYAASEGLRVVVIEAVAPGGQAGTSSKIENYLGFPTGISGQALAARAFTQAQKFGAEILVPRRLARLQCGDPVHHLELDGGETIQAQAVVLASGARYRKPPLPELEDLQSAGVHYGATHVEAQLCSNTEVALIGGGNSAGQAAVFLAGHARKVHMLMRGAGFADSMSQYLVRRIDGASNIELHPYTEVVGVRGEDHLEGMRWRNNATGEECDNDLRHLFVFIGAEPSTDCVDANIRLDDKGFVKTGTDLSAEDLQFAGWCAQRQPFLLETSCPRVFAAGDVRSGSTKRVAAGVGEGSVVVQFLHKVLAA
jgi:thioredoxin reductase (NADPH)